MADQRLAVVTGAAGGIGTAICERLAADGYRIAALDLSEKGLQALTQRCGGAVTPYALDQTREAEARETVARIEQELGPIDALVNVLGWTQGTRFDQEGSDYWRKVVAINYEALLYIAQPILLQMIGRKRGKMVFIASDAGPHGHGGPGRLCRGQGGGDRLRQEPGARECPP